MVAPKPLSFTEWQLQQYGNLAPQPTQAPPPAPAPAPVPSEVYGGQVQGEAVMATPQVVQTSYPASGAPDQTRLIAPPAQTIGEGAYAGMAPQQANAAYQENVPSWTVPFGMASAQEQQQAQQQQFLDETQRQYAETQMPRVREELRLADQAEGRGIYGMEFRGSVRQVAAGQRSVLAQSAYEQDLTTRARDRLLHPEQQGWAPVLAEATAPAGAAKDAIGGVLPDQLDAIGRIPGAISGAITGTFGVSEDANRRLAAQQAQAQPLAGMPGFGDVAASTVRGALGAVQAEPSLLRKPAAALQGIVVGASAPMAQVTEVIGTRAYDRTKGDENATYGDDLTTGFYEDLVGSGFSPIAFGRFADDPTNAPIIRRVYEQGYKGFTKGQAVYQFYRDQQGLGGVVTDIAYDPMVPAEAVLTLATFGAGGLALGAGRLAGKEAVGLAARNVVRGAGRAAEAVAFDPFDVGPVVRDAAGLVAPTLTARAGERATDIYRRHVLTEQGRREVVGRDVGVTAQRVAQSAQQRIADAPDPWLFERDPATGGVATAAAPGPGGGTAVRPLVRDPATGAVRPLEEADFDLATRIMARLPKAEFDRMANDWFGLGMNARNLRAAGMGSVVEKFYPRHGPAYERYVAMQAMRVRTRGQGVIDALYEDANRDFGPALADLDRIKKAAPKGKAATPAALAAHKTALRGAQNAVTRAAYQSHMVDAVVSIAGVRDAKAAQHKKMAKTWRQTARTLPGYGGGVDRAAMLASGAKILDPATGTLTPGRRLRWDELTDLDDDTLDLGRETLSTGEELGQLALDMQADLRRIQDLADQAATRAATGAALSGRDQKELSGLLAQYAHLFPGDAGRAFDPAAPAMVQQALDQARAWSDEQLVVRTGLEVQQRYAVDKRWLDKRTRQPTETGKDWADKTGPLGARLSGAVRFVDAVSRGTSKWLLHNPVRAPGFASLQLVGNAASQIVGKPDALFHYLRPGQWATGFRKLQGDETALTRYNTYAAASGMRPNARVQNALDPQRFGKIEGFGRNYFQAAKNAAAAFDLANAESTFMATVLKEEKLLQRWMRLSAGNALDGFSTTNRRTPIATARAMGVPAARVPDAAITTALDAARADKPWGILSAQEVKGALYDAAGVRSGADRQIDAWVDRVGRDYTNLRKRIDDAGLAEKDRIAFSWNETKADAVLSRVFMFHYWNTRASYLYARNLLGNPALLNGYVSLFRTLQQEADAGDYPDWLSGFARFMMTPAGIGVFLNPAATFNTMLTFAGDAMREEDYFKRLTPAGQAREKSPLMVHPVWDNLLFVSGMAGADARPSQLLPTAALNREIYNLVNLANVKTGGKIAGTDEGRPVMLDARLRNLAGGEATKALAEWFQDKIVGLGDPVRAGDPNASTAQNIYYLMVQQQLDKGLPLEQAQQAVHEIGGQFNPDSPEYQAALEQLAEAPFLGPGLGLDPESPLGRVVGALAARIGPFPAQTDVALRSQIGNEVGRYFDMQDAAPVYEAIVDGEAVEPIRVGGYRLQIPGTFAATESGGTVYTPQEIAAMDPARRRALADQWLASTLGATEANLPGAEFPETAYAVTQDATAADPHDLALQRADNRYWEAGTPEQNEAAAFSRRIAGGQLEEGEEVTVAIDGRLQTFDQADLAKMTEDERNQLRWLWVNDSGNAANVEGFYAAQAALVAAEPDLGGHQAMKRLADAFPDGKTAWVEAAIKDNPVGYGEYAARLDPARYPPGSGDWTDKMLSLEGYQTLVQERPKSSSPLAWETVPGAPVVPGLTGASSLNDLYGQQEAAREERKSLGVYMREGMDRLGEIMAVADAYDATAGYAPGTSRNKLMQRIVTGDSKNPAYYVDSALWDQLEADFSGTTEDGKTFGPIPGADSQLRQYIVWALRQPEDKRDPMTWAAEKGLKEEFAKAAEQGITTDAAGNVVLKEPVESATAAADVLAGLQLTRSVDGSGEFLAAAAVPTGTAAPSLRVGGLGGTLYQDASTTSQPLLALRPETPLVTLQEQGDWIEVEHPTGLTGWVRRTFLTRQPVPAPEEPRQATPPAATVARPAAREPVAAATATPPPGPSQPPALPGALAAAVAGLPPAAPAAALPAGNTAAPPTPQPGVLETVGNAVGGFVSGIGNAIGGITGGAHNGQGSPTPPTKPAVTSQPAKANAPATPSPQAATTTAPTTTPFYDVVPANDGIGVQSTIASDRTWMEDMLGGHAAVTVDYKAPAPVVDGVPVDYSYQHGHGAAGNNHAAYDISCDDGNCAGRPVKSPVSGIVVCAGYGQGTGGSVAGCTYSQNTTSPNADGSAPAHTVVIEVGRDAAGNPIQMAFNHMGAAALRPGQAINVGDVLGTMGNTPGGPHIHLEAWVGDPATGYQIVDPQLVVGGHFTGGTAQPPVPTAPAAIPGKVAPRTSPGLTPGDPAPYQPLVRQAATAHGVPAGILSALLMQESQYDPAALSPAGALGIAQFMPATAQGMGIDPLDPAQAIDGAARYLAQQYAAFGTWELALAAYNAGPGNVQSYGGIPPFPETQHYVATIMANAG